MLAATASAAWAQPDSVWQQLTAGERERLIAGEVLTLQRQAGADRGGARAAILVQAPVERVWDTITSCEQAMKYMAGMEVCEVREWHDDRALTRHVVDRGWLVPELDYVFATRFEPYRRMEFERVEGDVDALHGFWDFEPTAEGLLVRHGITLEPGVPVPRWIVRQSIAGGLPDMLRCIRVLAGGSASEQQAARDREACTG